MPEVPHLTSMGNAPRNGTEQNACPPTHESQFRMTGINQVARPRAWTRLDSTRLESRGDQREWIDNEPFEWLS